MSLTGTYVLQSNENYDVLLKEVGVPAEMATRMCAAKPKLELTKSDTDVTAKTTAGDKEFSNTIVFGKDSVIDVVGPKYTLNVTATDMGYSGSVVLGDKTGTIQMEATDAGLIQTVTVGSVTSKRIYTRQ